MGYKSLFEVMAMFQSTFLLSLLGYERSHAIDRKSDDDRFVLYINYIPYILISLYKKPHFQTLKVSNQKLYGCSWKFVFDIATTG